MKTSELITRDFEKKPSVQLNLIGRRDGEEKTIHKRQLVELKCHFY